MTTRWRSANWRREARTQGAPVLVAREAHGGDRGHRIGALQRVSGSTVLHSVGRSKGHKVCSNVSVYPTTRLRRLRRTAPLRSLVGETRVVPDDLVMPLFVAPEPLLNDALP